MTNKGRELETKGSEGKTDLGGEKHKVELTFVERVRIQNLYPEAEKIYAENKLRAAVMDKLIDGTERDKRGVKTVLECTVPACGYRLLSNESKVMCPNKGCGSLMKATNQINWDQKDFEGKAISDSKVVEFGEMSHKVIVDTLKKLQEAKSLEPIYNTLFEKFVLDGHIEVEEE